MIINKNIKSVNSKFIFTIVFLNSQIFSYAVNNPFGIKGVIEAMGVFLSLYTLHYLYSKSLKVKKIDFIIFLTPLILMSLSAFLALIKYNQPFYAGLIEERRMLSIYVYFPLIKYYRDYGNDINSLYKYIILSSIFAIFIGYLYQANIISAINDTMTITKDFRSDRATAGNQYVVISIIILYCTSLFKPQYNIKIYSLIFIFLLSLLFISQSRGILIALLLVILILYRNFKQFAFKTISISILFFLFLLFSISFDLKSPLLNEIITPFLDLTSEEYIQESVRSQSISKIINDFSIWGHGALWLQWQNGFARFYGEYFYLSDVGIWGTIFRYGIFSIIPISILLYFVKKVVYSTNVNRETIISTGIFLHIIFMLPIAAAFEYRGFIIALALVILARSKKESI